jgi:hypothetical protein
VKGANRLGRLAGRAGLCGLLLLGSIGAITRSDDATATTPPVQTSTGAPEDETGAVDHAEEGKSNSEKKSEKGEDNNANTAKARFLAIFMKMFQR